MRRGRSEVPLSRMEMEDVRRSVLARREVRQLDRMAGLVMFDAESRFYGDLFEGRRLCRGWCRVMH